MGARQLIKNPRRYLKRHLRYLLGKRKLCLLSYRKLDREGIFELISDIQKEQGLAGLRYNEAYQLYMVVKGSSKVRGDIAEVGVYSGGSAKLICEAKGDRRLHLFDTFNGMPSIDPIDVGSYREGQFSNTTLEDVQDYLAGYSHVSFYPGVFPATGKAVQNLRFSLVHLDVDIYRSTIEALRWFYPRMERAGIIISHDYFGAPGVRKAIDEFFEARPETIILLTGSQCLIVKT